MRLLHVVGARPNFVKIAPLYGEIARHPDLDQVLVHTGQHYDDEMSAVFFDEFGLPTPDVNLEVGSGTHAVQTAQVMTRIEPVLDREAPDWVVVVGDVNSTIAAALVATKKGIPVAHVEAGLRSFDRTMPEEVNRILTDRIADLLLTPSVDGDENLRREGVDENRIRFVGNIMIDTLAQLLPRTEGRWPELAGALGIDGDYALVTMHRPSNVDDPDTLEQIVDGLAAVADELPVLFPVHPRTRSRLQEFGLMDRARSAIRLLDPLGYIDFLSLTVHSRIVITDSGGIQEETTYLGVPCLTVRPNTERPVTISHGTNRLVASRATAIIDAARDALTEERDPGRPDRWDGRTAGRIVDALREAKPAPATV